MPKQHDLQEPVPGHCDATRGISPEAYSFILERFDLAGIDTIIDRASKTGKSDPEVLGLLHDFAVHAGEINPIWDMALEYDRRAVTIDRLLGRVSTTAG